VFVPSPKTLTKHSAALHPSTWKTEQEMFTGRTRVTVIHNANFRLNDTTVIEREFGSVSQVDPRDPAQASIHGWHVCRSIRPNVTFQGRTDVVIQSTATHFHITIDLQVTVNDAPHFTKRWAETVRREMM
jgi:hypothetical protein